MPLWFTINIVSCFFVVLHGIRLAHTDLKPENMLFVDSGYDVYWNENLVKVLATLLFFPLVLYAYQTI